MNYDKMFKISIRNLLAVTEAVFIEFSFDFNCMRLYNALNSDDAFILLKKIEHTHASFITDDFGVRRFKLFHIEPDDEKYFKITEWDYT